LAEEAQEPGNSFRRFFGRLGSNEGSAILGGRQQGFPHPEEYQANFFRHSHMTAIKATSDSIASPVPSHTRP
jgi:hypothetical protein